eukprot:CAMPEP_0185845096 /NCGR_PEP_ID=MMETSP1354-20130828/1155_1 /TAXON_ID=708628 /ORGANISM="Erythrolobus madagascarensis, Strain CCMP3276" /LENGTH=157 /DNA_ID=CAMNT_0028544977 /DNA_START=272 /DNA_END=741 /DNA_ORIENTATION=+
MCAASRPVSDLSLVLKMASDDGVAKRPQHFAKAEAEIKDLQQKYLEENRNLELVEKKIAEVANAMARVCQEIERIQALLRGDRRRDVLKKTKRRRQLHEHKVALSKNRGELQKLRESQTKLVSSCEEARNSLKRAQRAAFYNIVEISSLSSPTVNMA